MSSAISETLHAKEMSKGTREVFDYAICANCQSIYVVNFPADISEYYKDYYSFDNDIPSIDKSRLKLILASIYARLIVRSGLGILVRSFFRCPSPWQMRFISPNLQAFLFVGAKSDVRILDVGSGVGQFIKMMMKFGYTCAAGIDPFLDEAYQCDHVVRSDIYSLSGTYDVILFNHSLEHMTDLKAALKKCSTLLSPKGMIVIQIPNIHSREFTRFKQHWCWIHAPYHFAMPSRGGIELLAAKCGLKVVDMICTSRADHYLYSDEYSRDISDRDPNSVRRKLEDGSFDRKRYFSLSKLAYSLNKTLTGDWIAYYLVRT